MIISCENCKAQFKLIKEPSNIKTAVFKCPKCGKTSRVNPSNENREKISILIAHDDTKVITVIKRIIEPLNLNVTTTQDGYEAYNIIKSQKPKITIIDVALSGIFGFELCERIKTDPELKNVKVILVASIYDRTRYKRKPQNLYGADDYIEKHHIPDKLFEKVAVLSGNKIKKEVQPPDDSVSSAQLKDNRDILLKEKEIILDKQREEIRQHEQDNYENISDIEKRAKKLARLIVSDIALYNQEIFSDITLDNYKENLKMDVEDGIRHLAKKIPEVSEKANTYLHTAFEELIKKKDKG